MTTSNQASPVKGTRPVVKRHTLRAIAVFDALKGIAAFAAMIGAIDLMHHDVRHLAIELIGRFGQNPQAHYPSILLHYADLLPGADVRLLIVLASLYTVVRLLEAYGLWNHRAWGEWLGALSGGIYIPLEISHLIHRMSVISGAVLVGNTVVVGVLVVQLWHRRRTNSNPPVLG